MPKCVSRVFASGLPWLLLAVVIMLLDRQSKIWILSHVSYGEPIILLPFLNLTLAYNTGAAFSFLDGASGWQQYFLGGLAIVVTLIILTWLAKSPRQQYWQNISLSLILAGALGNAWDRLLYGHVIDFVNFHVGEWHFAIFNLADSAITVGAMMMILMWLVQKK